MEFDKIYNKGQAQLFKNQYLEYLTKTHPLVIWGMYLPVLVLLPFYSINVAGFSGTVTFMLFLSGIFFWSLIEYILHRFAFHHHAETERGKKSIISFMEIIMNIPGTGKDFLCRQHPASSLHLCFS